MARRLRFKLSECDCSVYPGENEPEAAEEASPTNPPTENEGKIKPQTYPPHVPRYLQYITRLPSYSQLHEEGPIKAIISDNIRLLNQVFRNLEVENNMLLSRDGTPALTVATAFNNRTVMRLLLDEGFNIDCLAPSGQYRGLSPLHVACLLGHTSAFNLLIDRGANLELATSTMMVNSDSMEGDQTCLHLATRQNHTYLCNIIVSMRQHLVNVADKEGLTPLHVACMLGHLSIVRLLLRSDCDVDSHRTHNKNNKGEDSVTPILHAIRYNQFSSARLLLEKADLNIKCELEYGRGLAPLHLATIKGEYQMVQDLLENGADPDQLADDLIINRWRYNTECLKPMHIAAFKGYVDIFETLAEKGDIKEKSFPHITPLCLAVANNQYDMVRYLLSTGFDINETINLEDVKGMTALHVAVDLGFTDITEHLLFKKANPNITMKTIRDKILYQTPLHLACVKQNIPLVKLLAPVTDWDLFDKNSSDPLLDSILNGQTEMVEILLNIKYEVISSACKGPEHVKVSFVIVPDDGGLAAKEDYKDTEDDIERTSDGKLQIRLGCSRRYYRAMQLFFSFFDVDSSKKSGQSLLCRAASTDSAFPVLSFLLSTGADTTEQNDFGYTALHTATESNNLVAVQTLLLADSDCLKPLSKKDLYVSFLKRTGRQEHLSPVRALNMRNSSGQTALYIAARGGHHKVVESLILAGADVNISDENGRTPLHLSSSMGWLAVSQLLLFKGDVEARCRWVYDRQNHFSDMTPLHLAALDNETTICKLLLDSGANINSCFQSHYTKCTTVLHLSIFKQQWDTTLMLLSRGSDANMTWSDNSTSLVNALTKQAPLRVIKGLLKAGADPNALSPSMKGTVSPLEEVVSHAVCCVGNVDLLLDFGADVNLKKDNGQTVLHEIVSYSQRPHYNSKAFSHLLKTSQKLEKSLETVQDNILSLRFKPYICDFNNTNMEGNTILHTALSGNNDTVFNIILKHVKKTQLFMRNGKGESLLQVAVTKRKHRIVRHLLEMGASVDDSLVWMELLKLEDEEMLMIFSDYAHSADILRLPLDSEGPSSGNYLHYSVFHSSEDYFNRILSLNIVDVNGLDSLGRTPLYIAVVGNRSNIALSLLAKGASVKKSLDYRDETGRDLLHITASTTQKMFLSLLTLHTPDINRRALKFQSEERVTALHIAAMIGQTEVIDILLRSGSDVTCLTSSGKDAKCLAIENGHELICQKLDSGFKMFQDADRTDIHASPETLLL